MAEVATWWWYIAWAGLFTLLLLAVAEAVAHAFMGVLPGDRNRAENFALALVALYVWLKRRNQ